jgi:hypothetical protein
MDPDQLLPKSPQTANIQQGVDDEQPNGGAVLEQLTVPHSPEPSLPLPQQAQHQEEGPSTLQQETSSVNPEPDINVDPQPPEHTASFPPRGNDPIDRTNGNKDGPPHEGTTSTKMAFKVEYINEKGAVLGSKNLNNLSLKTMYETNEGAVLEVVQQATVLKPWDDIKDNPSVCIHSLDKKYMNIRESELLRAIRHVVEYYPSGSSKFAVSSSLTVNSPYRMLQLYKEDLEHIRNSYEESADGVPSNERAVSTNTSSLSYDPFPCSRALHGELSLLLEQLDQECGSEIQDEIVLRNQNPPQATFNMLWHLFKPGTFVYTLVDGNLAACVVKITQTITTDIDDTPTHMTVHMWHLYFDGRYHGLS